MSTTLIKAATVVNEGTITPCDVLIVDGRIEKIAPQLDANAATEINAEGLHLLPGLIDDQVHFREPGLTHKADIWHESRAAVAGGSLHSWKCPIRCPIRSPKNSCKINTTSPRGSRWPTTLFTWVPPTIISRRCSAPTRKRCVVSRCSWGHPRVICW